MENKGFIFLDIIIGLFIIGLIVVVSFPMLTLINKSFEKTKEITDMSYLAESTVENLRAKDGQALNFLKELENTSRLEYESKDNEKYISSVHLENPHPKLWNIKISIRKKDIKDGGPYVEIKASIPK